MPAMPIMPYVSIFGVYDLMTWKHCEATALSINEIVTKSIRLSITLMLVEIA